MGCKCAICERARQEDPFAAQVPRFYISVSAPLGPDCSLSVLAEAKRRLEAMSGYAHGAVREEMRDVAKLLGGALAQEDDNAT